MHMQSQSIAKHFGSRGRDPLWQPVSSPSSDRFFIFLIYVSRRALSLYYLCDRWLLVRLSVAVWFDYSVEVSRWSVFCFERFGIPFCFRVALIVWVSELRFGVSLRVFASFLLFWSDKLWMVIFPASKIWVCLCRNSESYKVWYELKSPVSSIICDLVWPRLVMAI